MDNGLNARTKALVDAVQLINGDRQEDYGPPEVNFKRIAQRWSQHLGMEVTPYDVCLMMAELKLARLAHDHSRDSIVDAAAYLGLAQEMWENDYPR